MSDQEIASAFHRDGYAVVRNVFAAEELELLRREARALIEGGPRGTVEDFTVRDGYLWKINHPGEPAKQHFDDSLGVASAHPRIWAALTAIAGGRAMTQLNQSVVFKGVQGGPAVIPHRDTFAHHPLQQGEGQLLLTADIYLEPATEDNGCLYVVPGSQTSEDVMDLVARPIEDLPDAGFIAVPAEPGDVVFHDSSLVHGTKATGPHDGSNLRMIQYVMYADPEALATVPLVRGARPMPGFFVENLVAVTDHWAKRRQEVYGDVDYSVPAWGNSAEVTPNLRTAPEPPPD